MLRFNNYYQPASENTFGIVKRTIDDSLPYQAHSRSGHNKQALYQQI